MLCANTYVCNWYVGVTDAFRFGLTSWHLSAGCQPLGVLFRWGKGWMRSDLEWGRRRPGLYCQSQVTSQQLKNLGDLVTECAPNSVVVVYDDMPSIEANMIICVRKSFHGNNFLGGDGWA